MKKLILFALLFLFQSCEGLFSIKDYAGPTMNIEDAKKNKLLKNIYTPSKNKVLINEEQYNIFEAWTSYRFKSNKTNEKNILIYEFLITINNNKTKEFRLSPKITQNLSKFIKFYDQNSMDIIGIVDDKLAVSYDAKSNPNPPNIIKVGFKSGGNEDFIIFKKEK